MSFKKLIARDISWLSFNDRVLQEAADRSVPLPERIKFLGIVSNNLDEFFRVRVAALKKMAEFGSKAKMHLENKPGLILQEIQHRLLQQQEQFSQIWLSVKKELKKHKIFLLTEKELSEAQEGFVQDYFTEQVRSYIVPLMIETLRDFPVLNDKSIYLACTLSKKDNSLPVKFSLVSVPRQIPRFLILPAEKNKQFVILLEDVIRLCLPRVFSFFGYDSYTAHIIKVTRDAEFDIDNDLSTNLIEKIEKGLKSRKKGVPVRFIYDREINIFLLTYLKKRLGITDENCVPGGRIHNFKDFMNFPESLFVNPGIRKKPFLHPYLFQARSITERILKKDVMLHLPYHTFDSVIDLLREAAIDPYVTHIKITAYRLAPSSKVIHALTNAVRNGKQVLVMLELKARFDEEANLEWKTHLEEAGVKVLVGFPNLKVHAKLCIIRRKEQYKVRYYGFISTGNFNEKTAKIYGDHLLFTSKTGIMADVNRIFLYLEKPKERQNILKHCKKLLVTPGGMRKQIIGLINREIKNARAKRKAAVTVKLNSLSDAQLAEKLMLAARAGVEVKLIIRGICCMLTQSAKFKVAVKAISIVDEFLEHARVFWFLNDGKEKIFISSADWMVRNLDHRIETAVPIDDTDIKKELKMILEIQLSDNCKARIIDNEQTNQYVPVVGAPVRSQVETYNILRQLANA